MLITLLPTGTSSVTQVVYCFVSRVVYKPGGQTVSSLPTFDPRHHMSRTTQPTDRNLELSVPSETFVTCPVWALWLPPVCSPRLFARPVALEFNPVLLLLLLSVCASQILTLSLKE